MIDAISRTPLALLDSIFHKIGMRRDEAAVHTTIVTETFPLSAARLPRLEALDKGLKIGRFIQQFRANLNESLDLVFFERETRRQG